MQRPFKYLIDKKKIMHQITHLDVNGMNICEEYFRYGQQLYEDECSAEEYQEKAMMIVDKLMELIEQIYPSVNCKECQPDEKNPKCLNCHLCKPDCQPDKKNLKCYKCNKDILIFSNEDRLVFNKKKIRMLSIQYFTGKNEIDGPKTISLIKLHLSVLPALVR